MDWIKEDGTFTEGFEKNLPEDLRDYAKGAKDIVGLIRRGADTQREFHNRVKLPTDAEAKKKFLTEHFQDVLDADKKAAESEAAKQKEIAETTAKDTRQKQLDSAKAKTAQILGTDKAAETNVELCRRAFRGQFCPQWIKDGIAQAAGVEFEKITDAQFKEILAADPVVAETLLKIGDLTKDVQLPTGDRHGGKDIKEVDPGFPDNPEFYKAKPDDDPEKLYFINRGAKYENGAYVGGYRTVTP